jgi:aminoglycoside phosphotransferase (APT) family kinase protein
MRLVDGAMPFSVHRKLPGAHLLPAHYPALPEEARDRLSRDLARFHAELHAIPSATMAAAGVVPIQGWEEPASVLATALPLLPPPLHAAARDVARGWQALPPDRQVYGFFDGHGWNMAFDHAAGRLNGIYDFADSGLGPLHREFVPAGFVHPDLSRRLVAAYSALTGTPVDPDRVRIVAGMVRLWEVASVAGDPAGIPGMVANFSTWAEA